MVIGRGHRESESKTYMVLSPLGDNEHTVAAVSSVSEAELWHQLLAYFNYKDLANVHKFVDDIPKILPGQRPCQACQLRKARRLQFSRHFKEATKIGHIFHSDIVGKHELSFPD